MQDMEEYYVEYLNMSANTSFGVEPPNEIKFGQHSANDFNYIKQEDCDGVKQEHLDSFKQEEFSSVKQEDFNTVKHEDIDDYKQEIVGDVSQEDAHFLQSAKYNTMRVHVRELESQISELLQRFTHKLENETCLQRELGSAQAHIAILEAHMEELETRREEAVSTLFRLRPQRQECSEAEIKQDYDLLKASIESWVEKHCNGFLDNERSGYDLLEVENRNGSDIHLGYEVILKNFRSYPHRFDDVKDQVLIAIIMRFVYDNILNHTFPMWLAKNERILLLGLERSLEELVPARDVSTRSNWRSDTVSSIFNSRTFAKTRAVTTESLARSLLNVLQNTLDNVSNTISRSEILESFISEVVNPSFALAQKIQCASSDWEFEYSKYWRVAPGRLARKLPEFFDRIEDFHCVNISANRKKLKPPIDLSTPDQTACLIYILDVFPGLHCSRVDVDTSLPRKEISQPVLLVGFRQPEERSRIEQGNRGACLEQYFRRR